MVYSSVFATLNMRFMRILPKERSYPMKQFCKCALRDYLTECVAKTCKESNSHQAELYEKLMMDSPSKEPPKHGENLCCLHLFIIYLCFFCDDVNGLVNDLRKILDDYHPAP